MLSPMMHRPPFSESMHDRCGIAVANSTAAPVPVTLELTDRDGRSIAQSVLTVPAGGHLSTFLDELPQFATIPEYQGLLRITAATPGVHVLALRARINERGELLISSATPVEDNGAVSNADKMFVHVVFGETYSTSIVMFNQSAVQASGVVSFVGSDGSRMNIAN